MSKARATSASYPIRAVSRMTGIGIDTLRAWERRYRAVTPVRDDRGRMYTDADVARLRLLSGAVEQGHSIGRLAGLSNDELRDLCGAAGAVVLDDRRRCRDRDAGGVEPELDDAFAARLGTGRVGRTALGDVEPIHAVDGEPAAGERGRLDESAGHGRAGGACARSPRS